MSWFLQVQAGDYMAVCVNTSGGLILACDTKAHPCPELLQAANLAGPERQSAGPEVRPAGPAMQPAGPGMRSAVPELRSAGPELRSAGPEPPVAVPELRSAGPETQPAGPKNAGVASPRGAARR